MGPCIGCHGRLPRLLVSRSRQHHQLGVVSSRGAEWVPERLVPRGCMVEVRIVQVLDAALLVAGRKACLAEPG